MKRVSVLMGGYSVERDVSLASGVNCATALKEAGYQVETVDVSGPIQEVIAKLLAQKPEVVFNAKIAVLFRAREGRRIEQHGVEAAALLGKAPQPVEAVAMDEIVIVGYEAVQEKIAPAPFEILAG